MNLDQRRDLLKAGLTPYYRNVLDQFEGDVRSHVIEQIRERLALADYYGPRIDAILDDLSVDSSTRTPEQKR